MPPLPYTVTPAATVGLSAQLIPNSGMKKLDLSLVTEPSTFAGPEPVRDALRSGLKYSMPTCHRLSRKPIAAGLTAPPKGSCATATPAPPIPNDFIP